MGMRKKKHSFIRQHLAYWMLRLKTFLDTLCIMTKTGGEPAQLPYGVIVSRVKTHMYTSSTLFSLVFSFSHQQFAWEFFEILSPFFNLYARWFSRDNGQMGLHVGLNKKRIVARIEPQGRRLQIVALHSRLLQKRGQGSTTGLCRHYRSEPWREAFHHPRRELCIRDWDRSRANETWPVLFTVSKVISWMTASVTMGYCVMILLEHIYWLATVTEGSLQGLGLVRLWRVPKRDWKVPLRHGTAWSSWNTIK